MKYILFFCLKFFLSGQKGEKHFKESRFIHLKAGQLGYLVRKRLTSFYKFPVRKDNNFAKKE
jgi:hypothetical protein